MSEEYDFDRYWLEKFSKCLDETVGEQIRKEVMRGSRDITAQSDREEVLIWTNKALERLAELTDDNKAIEVMACSACQYSKEGLQKFRQLFEKTMDIDLVLEKMQEQFESFLKDELKLPNNLIEEIKERNMGFAGVRVGNRIIATKIPKSAFVRDWFNETDPNEKRAIYCHCPRIRDALKIPENTIHILQCFCGGGFYKAIWEEILQKPVKIEVLETVIHGSDVCKFAIYIQEDIS
jgi:hypothetical protein